MKAKIERTVAHLAARRIAGRALRRAGLLRVLPSGFVAALLAEGILLAMRELRARPELRQKLWHTISANLSKRTGSARTP